MQLEGLPLVPCHLRLALSSELRVHLTLPLIEIMLFQNLKPLFSHEIQNLKPLFSHEILDPLRPCQLTL
jgi:hypothetical protein